MSGNLVHITEERVLELLDWPSTVYAVESSLVAVSEKRTVQNPRTFTTLPNTRNILLCMPGYLGQGNGVLACKMVSAFVGNEQRDPPLPSILANILLFNEQTGELKAIIQATTITAWRTAAASVVATKYLHCTHTDRENNILAIMGAGTQGRIHAISFHNIFGFKEIRIWNRTLEKAQKLVTELKEMGIPAICCQVGRECVKDADVIVTATYSSTPVVEHGWVKPNVHINAVGAGQNHHSELDKGIYKNATIFVDHMDGAKIELAGLGEIGVELKAEVGALIVNPSELLPQPDGMTVFHSLGMAVEDGAVGNLVYERFIGGKK